MVYAAATDVSVGRMFLGGVIPGLMAGGMLMVGIYIAARWKGLPSQPFEGWGEVLNAGLGAFWGLMLIVIILGGIYGGIFTPTEAAAVAAIYAFFIANFIYKDMGPLKGQRILSDDQPRTIGVYVGAFFKWLVQTLIWFFPAFVHKGNKETVFEAGKLTIMLLFIIANALILKHVLTEERIPQMITESLIGAGLGVVGFLIMVNVLLLIGGQFMEPSGLLIIVAPLVFPIAMELGIDPIHLGIMMVVNMEIGMITPPVGLNLFVTAGVAQMSMMNVVKAAAPWLGIMFLFLIIVTYIPAISTWLPTLMMGPEIVTR
uniref:TRAP-type C4-dicarboxylate transport system, large permease component n=1 Tax=uncultured Thiotrichaceae bacterium TaxID=298394 RepID=A0A6S6SHK3_9GAMM|nr:MAG: TRAP-type C4-dicarboxylate transport system, large permease component [uncultured Thiotrichaceae bacterium]